MTPQALEQRAVVAAGKCRRCRKPNPDAGRRLLCPDCRQDENARLKRKRAARVAVGTCCHCQNPPLPGLVRCERHTRENNRNSTLSRRRRRTQEPAMPAEIRTEPPAAPPHFVSLEAAKEMIGRHIDAVLDQMSPADAITLVEWLKDDATGRVFEMDSAAAWPP